MDQVTEHGPIASGGREVKTVVADSELLNYARSALIGDKKSAVDYPACRQCETPIILGQEVILVTDKNGKRRGVYDSVSCQRQGFFNSVATVRKNRKEARKRVKFF